MQQIAASIGYAAIEIGTLRAGEFLRVHQQTFGHAIRKHL